ncbi:MAG: hypothetical protein ABIR23_01265, partial [Novosphingobium sp.]
AAPPRARPTPAKIAPVDQPRHRPAGEKLAGPKKRVATTPKKAPKPAAAAGPDEAKRRSVNDFADLAMLIR